MASEPRRLHYAVYVELLGYTKAADRAYAHRRQWISVPPLVTPPSTYRYVTQPWLSFYREQNGHGHRAIWKMSHVVEGQVSRQVIAAHDMGGSQYERWELSEPIVVGLKSDDLTAAHERASEDGHWVILNKLKRLPNVNP